MNVNFQIAHQYQLYLVRMKLNEADMHPEQKIQVKQAFYGAFGQLLVLMREEIAALPERSGVRVLEDLTKQVADFWTEDLERHRNRNN